MGLQSKQPLYVNFNYVFDEEAEDNFELCEGQRSVKMLNEPNEQ